MSISYAITAGEPVNQQIYRFLRHDIVTCAIPPGSLLSEKRDCVAVYRFAPAGEGGVYQADRSGSGAGLPQRGTFVRKISARRVADGRFIRGGGNGGGASGRTANVARIVNAARAQSTYSSSRWRRPTTIAMSFCGWTMNFTA
ncbi:hypothetical protein [Sodalis glossinidius]|uniref:hypothetical protein n=1 Tax=Sodalis glossinidius TaxID=63612 RepID=UPI00032510D1|nr:hypothetical protein [Sodalis glossinidius]